MSTDGEATGAPDLWLPSADESTGSTGNDDNTFDGTDAGHGDGDGDATDTGDGDRDRDETPPFCFPSTLMPGAADPCTLPNTGGGGKNYYEVHLNCLNLPEVDDCSTENGIEWVYNGPPDFDTELHFCGTACDDFVAANEATLWECPLP